MSKEDTCIRSLPSSSPSSSKDASPHPGGEAAESVTRLLAETECPGEKPWDQIYDLIYQDIYRIARSQIRQRLHPDFSPTSLISEAWLKLAHSRVSAHSHRHLLSLIARAMRFVLIDEARRVLSNKRGGHQIVKPLSSVSEPAAANAALEEVLALDNALESLARISPRLEQVVELRYYGGLKESEVAELLDVTERTVRRDWRKARAFLQTHLTETGSSGEAPTDELMRS